MYSAVNKLIILICIFLRYALIFKPIVLTRNELKMLLKYFIRKIADALLLSVPCLILKDGVSIYPFCW